MINSIKFVIFSSIKLISVDYSESIVVILTIESTIMGPKKEQKKADIKSASKKKADTSVKFETAEETDEFKKTIIEYVKDHASLWNTNDDEYLNNVAKERIWASFCDTYYKGNPEITVSKVKRSWKSLKDAFKREYRKLRKTGNTGKKNYAFTLKITFINLSFHFYLNR